MKPENHPRILHVSAMCAVRRLARQPTLCLLVDTQVELQVDERTVFHVLAEEV